MTRRERIGTVFDKLLMMLRLKIYTEFLVHISYILLNFIELISFLINKQKYMVHEMEILLET